MRQSLKDQLAPLGVHLLRQRRVLAVKRVLGRRRAAAEADLQPPAAQLIDHADLFDQAQRMVQGQGINHRAEAQTSWSAARWRKEIRSATAPCRWASSGARPSDRRKSPRARRPRSTSAWLRSIRSEEERCDPDGRKCRNPYHAGYIVNRREIKVAGRDLSKTRQRCYDDMR